MKKRRGSILSVAFSAATTTVTPALQSTHTAAEQATEIPIQSSSSRPSATILPWQSDAATKIQSSYRRHLIRILYRRIQSVNREADYLQCLIRRQETVDAIRSEDLEKRRMEESLMALLLRLDSVPGLNPVIREARKKVSRRIVEMQEILDSIVEAKGFYGCQGVNSCLHSEFDVYGWMTQGNYWEEVAEEEMCREKGGEEMDRFCAQYLGFRCFQRFLRD